MSNIFSPVSQFPDFNCNYGNWFEGDDHCCNKHTSIQIIVEEDEAEAQNIVRIHESDRIVLRTIYQSVSPLPSP